MPKFAAYILLSVIVLYSRPVRANHIYGGDIIWQYAGGDSFRVTAEIYRNCSGLSLANTPFRYFSDNAGYTTPKTVYGTQCCTRDVTPSFILCSTCQNPKCSSGIGVQLVLIQAYIKFPTGNCSWYISWQQQSRDGAITTGAAGETFYMESRINTCLSKPDNSPFFVNPGQNFFFVSTCTSMDNKAADTDMVKGEKDSISYTLTSPLQAHNTPVKYNTGYSYDAPFYTSASGIDMCGGFGISSDNGLIGFRADKMDISLCAVKIDEYRKNTNGVYENIGAVTRDMEMILMDHPENHDPVVTGINGGTTSSMKSCIGWQNCFTIKAFDIDPKDSVKITWDTAVPGATFHVTDATKKWPSATFCWKPNSSQARAAPYTFTVYAKDNAGGKAQRSFSMYAIPSPAATYKVTNLGCGKVLFQANDVSPAGASIASYLWVIDNAGNPSSQQAQNATFQFIRPGWQKFTLSITSPNGCNAYYNDSVFVVYPQITGLRDTVVCERSPVLSLHPSVTGGTAPYDYIWSTGQRTPSVVLPVSQDTVITLTVKDAKGCQVSQRINVHYQRVPVPQKPAVFYSCPRKPVILRSNIGPDAEWSFVYQGNPYSAGRGSYLYVYDSGLYYATAVNPNICPGTDSFRVVWVDIPRMNKRDTTVCYGDSVVLRLDSISGVSYKWIDVVHQKVVGHNAVFVIKNATSSIGGYHFQAIAARTQYGITCADTTSFDISLYPIPKAALIAPPQQCLYNPPYKLDNYGNAQHYHTVWSCPSNPAAIVNGYLYPEVMGLTDKTKGTGYIHGTFRDAHGCQGDDSVWVDISLHATIHAGPDTALWLGCGRYKLNNPAVSPITSGTWQAADPSAAGAIYTQADSVFFIQDSIKKPGDYILTYTYKAPTGNGACDGTDTVVIHMVPSPKISFTNMDTLCQGLLYLDDKAWPRGGTWQDMDTMHTSALFMAQDGHYYFDAQYAGAGPHYLKYILHNGNCTDTATVRALVPKILPSAEFHTVSGGWDFCENDHMVLLQVDTANAYLVGKGLHPYKPGQWYVDLNEVHQATDTISMYLYGVYGKCAQVKTHIITIHPMPHVWLLGDTMRCSDDDTFHLKAVVKNANGVYWKSPLGGQDGGVFLNNKYLNDSTYTADFVMGPEEKKKNEFKVYVTAISQGICDTVQTAVTIHTKSGPTADFVSQREGCEPFAVKFKELAKDSAGPITRFEWYFNDGSPVNHDSLPLHVFMSKNQDSLSFYDVKLKVYNAGGCSKSINKHGWIIVHGRPYPVIKATPQFTTLDRPVIHFSLDAASKNCDVNDSSTKYEWHFGDRNNPDQGGRSTLREPDYTYSDTGFYTVVVKVTNAEGCTGTDSAVNVVDIRPRFAIFIPNAFLPGRRKDGSTFINKIFRPVVTSYGSFSMAIYNRWGELLYETYDPDKGWDGTFRGQPAPDGAYIYCITVSDFYGQKLVYKGTVTLIR